MSFEAYRIAVRINLVENVTRGLTAMSAQFGRAGMDAQDLQRRLDKIAKTTLVGSALAASGGVLLKALQGPIDEAKAFQSEVARFTALGLGDKATSDAVKFANGMNIMGTSARENMKLLREATTITGDLHHAMDIAPMLAKMRFGIDGVMGDGHGAGFERMFQDAIKTTELRGSLINRATGQVDMTTFSRTLNMMTQAYVASGGLVKPGDYLAAIKTGGVSTKLMSDEAFFFGLGHFMQESGGSRTGTASMSMFQNWAMGRMPQGVAEAMAKAGLLNPAAIHYGKTGHITKVDPMGLKRANEFVENPFHYVNSVMVPQLQAQGFKGNDLNIKLASLLGIRTASNLADQFVREEKVANLYTDRARKAADVDGLYKIAGGTMQGKELDLEARWRDVLKDLGTTVLPIAIEGVEKLTGALKVFNRFTKEHPTITKYAMEAAGLVGVVATVGGGFLLLKSTFMALKPLIGAGPGLFGLFGRLAGALGGKAGLVGAAGFALIEVGRLAFALKGLWDATHHEGVGLTADAQARLNDPRLKDFDNDFKPRDTVRGRQAAADQRPIVMTVDGHVMAKVTSNYQTWAANKPGASRTFFDPTLTPVPIGIN